MPETAKGVTAKINVPSFLVGKVRKRPHYKPKHVGGACGATYFSSEQLQKLT